jgi:hypothetical protein
LKAENLVKAGLSAALAVFASVLFVLSVCGLLVPSAAAYSSLVWEGDVYSSGVEVTSAVLNYGGSYRVVAAEVWYYNNPGNLAADAMYYTTDPSDTVYWGNYAAAPGGGSFLQINGQNVSWGPFVNGAVSSGGHTYTVYLTGAGAALTFKLVDLVDHDTENNVCHLHVRIYSEVTVGGNIADVVPSATIVGFVVGAVAFAAVGTVPVVRRRRQV